MPGAGKGKAGRGKTGGKTQSRSAKAGLQFPVGRIARYLKKLYISSNPYLIKISNLIGSKKE